MTTICMWVWEHAEGGHKADEASEERSGRGLLAKEERLALAVTADLLAAFLSAALLPVYTLKTGKKTYRERLALAVTADLLTAFLSAALLSVYNLKTGKAYRERLALDVTADLLAAFLSVAILSVYTLKTGYIVTEAT